MIAMEAKLIDIRDFIHDGEGGNGESLIHRNDSRLLLKLYNSTAPKDLIQNEIAIAQKVWSLGIPSPKPGEYVTDGNGRYGILFERLVGKRSFSRAIGDSPEDVEKYARRFARVCLKLHSVHPPVGMFQDVKEFYRNILKSNAALYTAEETEKINETLDNAPDGDVAIHGDLQFSNALMVGDKDYLIDLGDFCTGAPEFDLGMVLFTSLYDDEAFLREFYHMEPDTAARFWHFFVKEYYGENADPDEIEMKLRPYAMMKLLLIERNTDCILPHYHWLFK